MAWMNPWHMVFKHLPMVPLSSVVANIMKFYRHDRAVLYLGYGDVPPFRVTFCSKLCSLRVCFSSYPKLCSLRVYIFLHFSTQGRYFVFFISSKVLNFSPTLNLISTIVSTTYPYLSSSIPCTPLNVALNIEPPASDSSGETRRSSRKRTALVRDFS